MRDRKELIEDDDIGRGHPVDDPIVVHDRDARDDHFSVRDGGESADLKPDLVRQPFVVIIAVGDKFARRGQDAGVAGAREAGSPIVREQLDRAAVATSIPGPAVLPDRRPPGSRCLLRSSVPGSKRARDEGAPVAVGWGRRQRRWEMGRLPTRRASPILLPQVAIGCQERPGEGGRNPAVSPVHRRAPRVIEPDSNEPCSNRIGLPATVWSLASWTIRPSMKPSSSTATSASPT